MLRFLFITFLLLLLTVQSLSSYVFKIDEEKSYLHILLFSSLDYANHHYNQRYISGHNSEYLSNLSANEINFIDRQILHEYDSELSKRGGYATLSLLAATSYFTLWDQPDFWTNFLVMSEVLVTQAAIGHWTKSLVLRDRPYLYAESTPQSVMEMRDARLSFYSLHTSTAFSLAYLNFFYQQHSYRNHYVTAGAYGLAIYVGASRVLSGEHFITDVAAGAVAGTLISHLICMKNQNRANIVFTSRSIDYQIRF